MTRVKICGITREEDLDAAVAAGADAIGLIVDVPVDTPRELTVERAAILARATPPFVTTVLVTMPASPRRTVELAEEVRPDVIQLHGDATPEALAGLKAGVDARIVKTANLEDTELTREYDRIADALLVDSVDGQGAGGTGRTLDWARTRDLAAVLDSPLILAGGLTPENVAEAVRTVDPYAVDVASGVERAGGEKDHDAVRAFVQNAKRADIPEAMVER